MCFSQRNPFVRNTCHGKNYVDNWHRRRRLSNFLFHRDMIFFVVARYCIANGAGSRMQNRTWSHFETRRHVHSLLKVAVNLEGDLYVDHKTGMHLRGRHCSRAYG
ncbi:MAG: hypothetical protein V7606_2605, partial [Burkholderiales bacterium]